MQSDMIFSASCGLFMYLFLYLLLLDFRKLYIRHTATIITIVVIP